MFRRLEQSLPEDARYEAELDQLGYFITDKDQIRMKRNPEMGFKFKISRNSPRHNEVHREAMNACIRRGIDERMEELGTPLLFLPQLTTEKPKAPHVPIYATAQDVLKTKKRVLIVVNDHMQDLGVWSYRLLSGEGDGGFARGSCAGLATAIKHRSRSAPSEAPGLLVLNPGQLLYSHKEKRAMSMTSWHDKPRQSMAHKSDRVHPAHNSAEGNRTIQEHVAFVFDKIVKDAEWVAPSAEIYVIGIGEGGNVALRYISNQEPSYWPRIAAMALTSPHNTREEYFRDFVCVLGARARAWIVSTAPFGTVLDASYYEPPAPPAPDPDAFHQPGPPRPRVVPFCPVFSSEEPHFAEYVLPAVLTVVLEWFEHVAVDARNYANPHFDVVGWEDDVCEAQIPGNLDLEGEVKAEEDKIENFVFADGDGDGDGDGGGTVTTGGVSGKENSLNSDGNAQSSEKRVIAGIEVDKSWLEEAGLLDNE